MASCNPIVIAWFALAGVGLLGIGVAAGIALGMRWADSLHNPECRE